MPYEFHKRNHEDIQGQDHTSTLKDTFPSNPGWIIRHGIFLFLALLLCLLILTAFIKYPVTIKATGRLISINPPKEIIASSNARIAELYAIEGKTVHQHEILAVMETDAHIDDVNRVSAMLDSMGILWEQSPSKLPAYLGRDYAHLGELQSAYNIFLNALQVYCDYIPGGFYFQEAAHLHTSASILSQLADNNKEQEKLFMEDMALSEENFHASTILHEETVIPDAEFRTEKSKLIAKHLNLPALQSNLLNIQLNKNDKSRELNTLQNNFKKQEAIFRQALATMHGALESWKSKYLLTAPVEGVIHFLNHAEKNMLLQAGQVICFVFPANTSFYLEASISSGNYGNVVAGQQVLIRFPAFDYHELGTIAGKVSFVSKIIDKDAGMKIAVALPTGLHTNYKKSLVHYEGLQADLEIITSNKRLSDRFFQGIGNLLQRAR